VIDERLPGLLRELADDVDGPPLARAAWAGAARVRRRRRVAAATVAAAAVAGVVPLVARTVPASPPAAEATSAPGPTAAPVETPPRVRLGPARDAVAGLPALAHRLAALDRLPATAAALSDDPAGRILAAAQRDDGPVLLLGRDGRWRQVDPVAGRRPRLAPTSISPDGGRLALAQDGGVVLVDLRTGADRQLPITGSVAQAVESVAWLADGTHVVVGGDRGDVVLSTADGGQRAAEPRDRALAVGGTPEDGEIRQWYGGAWRSGGRVAGTGFRAGDDQQVLGVADAATGRVTHVLELPYGVPPATRSNGCCATLGWLDAGTVLFRDGGHVLAWRPDDGDVRRVARLPGTSGTGRDAGTDVTLAIAAG
jgi:hypothetical protein